MKLQEIFSEWEKDSKIDPTKLDIESLNIPVLHNKYYKIFVSEKLLLIKTQNTYNTLKHDKKEFLTLGPDEHSREKGWQLPPRGKILKAEAEEYLLTDTELIELGLKVATQKEKVELLISIIDSINKRSFQIKNAIEFIKFQNGIS